MTPKEKAKELVDRYFKDYGEKMPNGDFMLCVVSIGRAKQCALIAVDEIIEITDNLSDYNDSVVDSWDFWKKVKEEIKKL